MAPLAQALQVSFQSKCDDGTFLYHCELDPDWAVVAIPQGGYSLGTIVQACIQYQSGSSHTDPVHVSAHFLRATNPGVGQVQLKQLKSGKTFTNILAELVQQGTTRISAHLLFGDLSPSQPSQEQKILSPPSPYARRVPLYSHPGTVSRDANLPPWAKNMHIQMAVDTVLENHNDPNHISRTTSESVGGGGTVWGAWCELSHTDDRLTTSSIPFFCDTFINLPQTLPKTEPGSTKSKNGWYPTITMTVEFKARIPSSYSHSTRTVGLFSEARFMNNPEGRHNARVEVWSAPSQIGKGDVAKGWRDGQYCIAVADQMALVLPTELNIRQGTKDSARL